jgi:hypothetical protein
MKNQPTKTPEEDTYCPHCLVPMIHHKGLFDLCEIVGVVVGRLDFAERLLLSIINEKDLTITDAKIRAALFFLPPPTELPKDPE